MDTPGAIIDKIFTVGQKLWNAQEKLYEVRRMTFDEFKVRFGSEDGLRDLWGYFKQACDLNCQRNQLIDEFDQRLLELTGAADDGRNVQRKHKTY